MNSIRKWLYKPKKTDDSFLAQFYFCDEELNLVAAELDSFDGRKDPERCTMLVNQLRVCQDKVLTIIQKIMDEVILDHRANRDFRVKFPDDVLQDSLSGQLWFGAECLAAGSSILNREVESASMRPLARALTKNLDSLRGILREQCLRSCSEYSDRIKEALVIFDKLFAEFELSYVSAMVPVKTMKEYDLLQEVTVLFSETVQRALEESLLTQDMIDYCDPALMFTIPRLAIVCGLLIYPEGPLNPDKEPTSMTEMYRPFQTLLHKIRELLYTLSANELSMLEKALCSSEEPDVVTSTSVGSQSETSLQVDQGFHEVVAPLDVIGSNIFVHSPSSGSPVTPVNMDSMEGPFQQLSPTSTLTGDMNQSDNEEGGCMNLNKSESQDSGLQSEIVSTSDTVLSDCPPVVSLDGNSATGGSRTKCDQTLDSLVVSDKSESTCTVTEKESGQLCDTSPESGQSCDLTTENGQSCNSAIERRQSCDLTSCDDAVTPSEGNSHSDVTVETGDCRPENSVYDIKQLCKDIVDEIIINAVHYNSEGAGNDSEGDDSSDKTEVANDGGDQSVGDRPAAAAYTRQYSWQYNVQFALPSLSMNDSDSADRRSSGSFSSDSTISENAGPGSESVTDFVIETLANMNLPRDSSESSRPVNNDSNCSLSLTSHQPSTSHCTQQLPYSSTKASTSSNKSSKRPDNLVKSHTSKTSSNSHHQSTLDRPASGSCSVHRHHKPDKQLVENITCDVGSTVGKDGKTGVECKTCSECKTGVECKSHGSQCSEETSSCSSTQSCCSTDCECETQCSCLESETSSCTSDNNDEEIALAIHAAEIASRNEARSRFRNSEDLIHRLFVCIAGVADQLQTNYASDLRHILKCVFELNSSYTDDNEEDVPSQPDDVVSDGDSHTESSSVDDSSTSSITGVDGTVSTTESSPSASQRQSVSQPEPSNNTHNPPPTSSRRIFDEPPEWVPDKEVERCTACKTPFTFVRRRHHCRNCGKIFCGKCSSTTVPLPQYGHQRPVRVCHRCFLYQVSHFTVSRDY